MLQIKRIMIMVGYRAQRINNGKNLEWRENARLFIDIKILSKTIASVVLKYNKKTTENISWQITPVPYNTTTPCWYFNVIYIHIFYDILQTTLIFLVYIYEITISLTLNVKYKNFRNENNQKVEIQFVEYILFKVRCVNNCVRCFCHKI